MMAYWVAVIGLLPILFLAGLWIAWGLGLLLTGEDVDILGALFPPVGGRP